VLRVGLTGGAGAGKSTVAARLRELGAVVIDADALAREVLQPGSDGLREVAGAFGRTVLRPDGSLDRGALAAVVFADPERRRELEAITHPRIAARTSELLADAPADAVVVHDVPLLVEKAMAPAYDLVVVVDAPVERRVQRLVGRGLSETDARARIAAQATEAERRAVADVWLDNDGDVAALAAAVDALWQERLAAR
jgi:dephospho-CoA kinase